METFRTRKLNGEYASARKSLTKLQKRILGTVIVACFSIGLGGSWAESEGFFGNELHVVNSVVATVAEAAETELSARELIEMKKRELVRDLSDKCEFKDKKHSPYHIDQKDSGGYQVVFADFQFYPPTIVDYMALEGETLTLDDAIVLALDEKRAFDLAYTIIWKYDGLHNWGNCANRLNLFERKKEIEADEARIAND